MDIIIISKFEFIQLSLISLFLLGGKHYWVRKNRKLDKWVDAKEKLLKKKKTYFIDYRRLA